MHLGLHKTATTSLQKYIFPNIPEIKFLGRSTEQLLTQHPSYIRLAEYCFSDIEDRHTEGLIKEDLQKHLRRSSVIISDEWFTADFDGFYKFSGAHWQLKVLKLSRIIAQLNYEILITLRDPYEGSFSQYTEFNQVGIEKKYPSFYKYILESNDSLVYKYDSFSSHIESVFNRVNYLRYEDVISNPELFSEIFSVKCKLNMYNSNRKKKVTDGIYVKKKSIIISSIIRMLPQKFINNIKRTYLFKAIIVDFLSYISKPVLIPHPNEAEKKLILDDLKESIIFYSSLNSFKR